MLKYTRDQILGFDEKKWSFRRSSGYAGYDPITVESKWMDFNDERAWIYEEDYMNRKRLKAEYETQYALLTSFMLDVLPTPQYSDELITKFLEKKFNFKK